jgi:Flp pilus assembly protein TadG
VRRSLHAACGNRRAAALVEFALILPVMVFLFFGTFEATELVRAYMKVGNATQAYANLVAADVSGALTLANLSNDCAGARLVLTPYAGASFSAAIASVTNNGGTASQDWHDTTQCGSGIGSISGTSLAPGNLTPNNNDSIIVVQGKYAYTSGISYLLPASQIFVRTAFARPRNNTTLSCPACSQH